MTTTTEASARYSAAYEALCVVSPHLTKIRLASLEVIRDVPEARRVLLAYSAYEAAAEGASDSILRSKSNALRKAEEALMEAHRI